MGIVNRLQDAVTTLANTNHQPATNVSPAAQTVSWAPLASSPTDLNSLASAVLFGPARATTGDLRFDTDQVKDTARNNLDSLSDMGETESLRLQMAMDRLSKMMQTLSNVLKKIADTASGIVGNFK